MIADYVTLKSIEEEIPGHFEILKRYDEKIKSIGGNIIIRTNDNTNYFEYRYQIETSDKNQEKILNSELHNEINSTCSWCGCKKDVQIRSNTFDWSINEQILCPDCYAFVLYKNAKLKDLIKLKTECSSLSEKYRSLKFKIINPQQELDFVKLEKLHYIADKVFLETNREGYLPYKNNIAGVNLQQDNFIVEVDPIGVYTGIRDITNERVYTGDIVCHGIDSTKAPEFGINDCEFCYKEVRPNHNRCGHISTREMKIKEWCTVNLIDGFWPVPWRALTHPIVIGHHGLKHFRKITSELNVLPENIKQKVIENIKLFQNDYNVKILAEN